MSRQYTEVSYLAIDTFFKDINSKKKNTMWTQIYPEKTFEAVYAATINERFELRIYTSVSINTNTSREVGKDAIRIIIYDIIYDKVFKTTSRINRNGNIFEKIKIKGSALWKSFNPDDYICPKCNAPLVFKKSVNGKFLGCSKYRVTGCKGTKKITN